MIYSNICYTVYTSNDMEYVRNWKISALKSVEKIRWGAFAATALETVLISSNVKRLDTYALLKREIVACD